MDLSEELMYITVLWVCHYICAETWCRSVETQLMAMTLIKIENFFS